MESPRVLVADDSPAIVRLLEMSLRRTCVVSGHTDAETAYAAGMAESWDLALVDVSMPSMSGLEMTSAWKREGRRFPVVVLSGHQVPDGGLPDNVADWITKPFDPQTIRDVVARHVPASVI